jgi:hypothetical protein
MMLRLFKDVVLKKRTSKTQTYIECELICLKQRDLHGQH